MHIGQDFNVLILVGLLVLAPSTLGHWFFHFLEETLEDYMLVLE